MFRICTGELTQHSYHFPPIYLSSSSLLLSTSTPIRRTVEGVPDRRTISRVAQTSALTTTLPAATSLSRGHHQPEHRAGTFAARDDSFLTLGQAVTTRSCTPSARPISQTAQRISTPRRHRFRSSDGRTRTDQRHRDSDDRFAGQVMADRDYVDDLVKTFPTPTRCWLKRPLRDYFGFYLCDAFSINGKGGQPVFIKLAGQDTGGAHPNDVEYQQDHVEAAQDQTSGRAQPAGRRCGGTLF